MKQAGHCQRAAPVSLASSRVEADLGPTKPAVVRKGVNDQHSRPICTQAPMGPLSNPQTPSQCWSGLLLPGPLLQPPLGPLPLVVRSSYNDPLPRALPFSWSPVPVTDRTKPSLSARNTGLILSSLLACCSSSHRHSLAPLGNWLFCVPAMLSPLSSQSLSLLALSLGQPFPH